MRHLPAVMALALGVTTPGAGAQSVDPETLARMTAPQIQRLFAEHGAAGLDAATAERILQQVRHQTNRNPRQTISWPAGHIHAHTNAKTRGDADRHNAIEDELNLHAPRREALLSFWTTLRAGTVSIAAHSDKGMRGIGYTHEYFVQKYQHTAAKFDCTCHTCSYACGLLLIFLEASSLRA